MKQSILLSLILAFIASFSFAQSGIKIHVETLKPPTGTLQEEDYETALKDIVRSGKALNTRKYDYKFDKSTGRIVNSTPVSDTFQYHFVARSKINRQLVLPTLHPFYDGMFEAYAHHRPFVLSPDMIWLLIAQGFAQHINNNAEKLRHYFVQQKGQISLVVASSTLDINNPDAPWEIDAFPVFTDSIGHYTGKGLMGVLTNNFSTSTQVTITASQITAMESMKAYFEFVVMVIGCGIPDITLQGTPQDWEKVREKAQYLKKYDLNWWIDSIDPVLKKIVAASKGERDTAFWQGMFKYHEVRRCGGGSVSNGWIVKFFPYNKDGHRNNLDSISGSGMLPPEIVNVPLKYITVNADGSTKKEDLELWAGFVGLSQNKTDFALKPEIGWLIRKKDADDDNKEFINKFTSQDNGDFPVRLYVNEFPKALLQIPHIRSLELDFTDSIHIPDEANVMTIDRLILRGKITKAEAMRISELLPNTLMTINGISSTDFNGRK